MLQNKEMMQKMGQLIQWSDNLLLPERSFFIWQ